MRNDTALSVLIMLLTFVLFKFVFINLFFSFDTKER